jgi:enoyl-CoA hydratase/carnithine racemase
MVDVEREGPVARIFLNRPEKANALSSEVLTALRRRVEELAGDASLRAVVLAGRGRVFCGGADVRELEASVVEAALLPRLMGAGRAAWLVLTGEPIDARRALDWGLVEEICDGEALLAKLLAADPEALRTDPPLA